MKLALFQLCGIPFLCGVVVAIAQPKSIADAVIDDHGNGCGQELSGDNVIAAGQILAQAAPRLNFRLIVADKIRGQWSQEVRRSIIRALSSRQIPVIVTCSRGTGPQFTLEQFQGLQGRALSWQRLPVALEEEMGLPRNVRILLPTYVQSEDIPF